MPRHWRRIVGRHDRNLLPAAFFLGARICRSYRAPTPAPGPAHGVFRGRGLLGAASTENPPHGRAPVLGIENPQIRDGRHSAEAVRAYT